MSISRYVKPFCSEKVSPSICTYIYVDNIIIINILYNRMTHETVYSVIRLKARLKMPSQQKIFLNKLLDEGRNWSLISVGFFLWTIKIVLTF